MRISVVKTDPDYVKDIKNYIVTLDGTRVIGLVSANEEFGEVLVYKMDENDNVVMSGTEKDKVLVEVLTGEVVIEKKPNFY